MQLGYALAVRHAFPLESASRLVAAPVLAWALLGCNAIFGIEKQQPLSQGAGGASATTSTTVSGGGSASGSGGGGTTGECTPGEARGCYSGPPATENVGACSSGEQSCRNNGTWGLCMDEVLPTAEVCGNAIDEDCDGALDNFCLSDEAVVVRYYIDESGSGMPAANIDDSTASPLDLNLTYSGGLNFTEIDGSRALNFPTSGTDSGAYATSAAKVDSARDGHTQATIEWVGAVQTTDPAGSPVLYIGSGIDGDLTVMTNVGLGIELYLGGIQPEAAWVGTLGGSRKVHHLLIDLFAGTAELFIDGVAEGTPQAVAPPVFIIPAFSEMVVGNAASGNRSFVGHLSYLAIYNRLLSEQERADHYARLSAGDDETAPLP
jgi:hypothetical protein